MCPCILITIEINKGISRHFLVILAIFLFLLPFNTINANQEINSEINYDQDLDL